MVVSLILPVDLKNKRNSSGQFSAPIAIYFDTVTLSWYLDYDSLHFLLFFVLSFQIQLDLKKYSIGTKDRPPRIGTSILSVKDNNNISWCIAMLWKVTTDLYWGLKNTGRPCARCKFHSILEASAVDVLPYWQSHGLNNTKINPDLDLWATLNATLSQSTGWEEGEKSRKRNWRREKQRSGFGIEESCLIFFLPVYSPKVLQTLKVFLPFVRINDQEVADKSPAAADSGKEEKDKKER